MFALTGTMFGQTVREGGLRLRSPTLQCPGALDEHSITALMRQSSFFPQLPLPPTTNRLFFYSPQHVLEEVADEQEQAAEAKKEEDSPYRVDVAQIYQEKLGRHREEGAKAAQHKHTVATQPERRGNQREGVEAPSDGHIAVAVR